jgi:hypothetical protein
MARERDVVIAQVDGADDDDDEEDVLNFTVSILICFVNLIAKI